MKSHTDSYISRVFEPVLRRYLGLFAAVAVTGPRQAGKSTSLCQCLGESYRYVTFDDDRIMTFLLEDPEGFIAQYNDKVIFDEAQKVPQLFALLKRAIDQEPGAKGRFVIAGSQQFALMRHLTESLAGRVGLLTLLPMQLKEVPDDLKKQAVFGGGYPELVMRSYANAEDWYASYIATYLERDVRALHQVGDLRSFRRLIQLLATQIGQVVNYSSLACDVGVSVPTVKQWLSVLEASYIITLVQPYYQNLGKRVIKAPKVYFYDTGLAAYFTGIQTEELFEKGPMLGPLFENFVMLDLIKQCHHQRLNAELYYLRVGTMAEVDGVLDFKTKRTWLEIKSSSTFHPRMAKHLATLKPAEDSGVLVYRGEAFPYKSDLQVQHYEAFLLDDRG